MICALSLGAGAAAGSRWEKTSRLPQELKRPLERDPMNVTVHRLKNGLTVYLSPNPLEPRITAWIAVRAGSAQDAEDSTGMAHYLEHMMFKGSRRLGTIDYDKEKPHLDRVSELYETLFDAQDPGKRAEIYKAIDEENQKASRYAATKELSKAYKRLGIRSINAFTGNERTAYVCDLPKNRLEAWAKLESDRFAAPVFRLFQTEIETVYEEKNRSQDDPDRILWEVFDRALFQEHPYGRTTLGSIEHLKNPSMAKMYAFYHRYYVPNNMAIILSGDFEREEALKIIQNYFARWQPKDLPEPSKRKIKKPRFAKHVKAQYEAEEKLYIGWHTVSANHPDADALQVMSLIFDNGESGLINLRLNQAQKVKKAGAFGYALNEAGVMQMYAVPKQGQTLKEAEKLLLETADAVKEGDFSAEDLRAIVTNYEIHYKRELEENRSRVSRIMEAFIHYREWPDEVDRLDRIRKVTKEDVIRVAKEYLRGGRVVAYREKGKAEIPGIEKPDFTKIQLDASRESAFLREILATPAGEIEPKWLRAGKDYKIISRPFGKLFHANNPVNDLFEIRFRFYRGRRHEPRLCAALSLWDLAGAGDMPAEEFKKELFRRGLTFATHCGQDTSLIVLSGLEEHYDEALRLMRLRFAQPNIAAGTLAKMVEIKAGEHKDNKVDPRYLATALSEFAQRGEDSEVLSELSDEALGRLTREELVEVLGSVFDYGRYVGYVGVRRAQGVLKSLQVPDRTYQPAPPWTPRKYLRTERPKVVFVHRDMVQSQIGMYAADTVFNAEEFVDYAFYRMYMGGGMSSVVFQEVREARALAYSAWGGYVYGAREGDENRLLGRLGTQADKTVGATVLLAQLLRDFPASEERFTEAQKSIVEEYRTNPVKFRAVPQTVMSWRDHGLVFDPRPRRMERAQAYTLADLSRFAARFSDVPLTYYILGSRERVDLEELKKLGELVEKKVDDLFPY